MIVTEEQLKKLEDFLLEQPAKFTIPILNYLNEIKNSQRIETSLPEKPPAQNN